MTQPDFGCVVYRGPSLLTGEPIVAIATGLDGGSGNPKTGPMVQTWILRVDVDPREAVRARTDDAICGDCALRGEDGMFNRPCYVTVWFGPKQVWTRFTHDDYPAVARFEDLAALFEGLHVRVGSYGDPAAVPFEVWRQLLTLAGGWVAYTHQWRRCDPRFKTIAMASVDTVDEAHLARLAGWRTFRVRGEDDGLLASRGTPLEIACPASDEQDHRTTCQHCQLCRGTNRPARSIAIIAHGKPGNVAAFYRRRVDALYGAKA